MTISKRRKNAGQTKDISLKWVLKFDKDLEEWRELAEEWLKTKVRGKSASLAGISKFFQKYIISNNLTRNPKDFLTRGNVLPDFYVICFGHYTNQDEALKIANKIVEFIDWILLEKYSIENNFGFKQIPAELNNPLTKYIPNYISKTSLNESDKNILPYRYLKELRAILCPVNAVNFNDWEFIQKSTYSRTSGDWFIVDESIIDKNDPDCVYKKRESSK